MGSATREALARGRAALTDLGDKIDLATAEDLFAAGRAVGASAPLKAALADSAATPEKKAALVDQVFGSKLGGNATVLLKTLATSRFSDQDDLLVGLEDLGIRAAAIASVGTVSVEDELFTFGEAVASNSELELALGNKLGDTGAKLALVDRLLDKASPATRAIVDHLIAQPRGRRVRKLTGFAASIVADAAGLHVATVTSAAPIAETQLNTLNEKLSAMYGRRLQLNTVIDPSVVGGLRVQIGDDVIDGSIATRIKDLKLQLQH
ncbi:F0F1 ATP synthase subunit delta [Homoserinimonas sp. OAct 916]|uniref:F0F1 ATP synthase subunit delta n=1 Tax=Homoserinimonas sp. OAct 916 TaxID=2211450 RepID=UPI000DBE55D7|nr:F0F1 ATP synthase subunit delta [Homoserinimonas sp. OAct 916]